jgi:RNA polymerase sigma-70 factor (ECF subfamily)
MLSAEDVIQETYADAFHDIGHFDPEGDGSFGGWLLRIAQCNLRDAVRMLGAEKRGGRHRRVEIWQGDDTRTALLDLLTATGSSPSRQAAGEEACSLLDQAINKLPRDYRTVVQMYDLQGESATTISEVLQRSPGAVYMLRARAHDWLRELMGTTSDFFADSV